MEVAATRHRHPGITVSGSKCEHIDWRPRESINTVLLPKTWNVIKVDKSHTQLLGAVPERSFETVNKVLVDSERLGQAGKAAFEAVSEATATYSQSRKALGKTSLVFLTLQRGAGVRTSAPCRCAFDPKPAAKRDAAFDTKAAASRMSKPAVTPSALGAITAVRGRKPDPKTAVRTRAHNGASRPSQNSAPRSLLS
jgi:hypothetical protein